MYYTLHVHVEYIRYRQGSRFIDVKTDPEAFWTLLLQCVFMCNPFQRQLRFTRMPNAVSKNFFFLNVTPFPPYYY